MMASLRKELLVFGYIREFYESINKEYPTKDLIYLFAKWFALIDCWDKEKTHKGIQVSAISDTIAIYNSDALCASCIGSFVVKKGDIQSWTLKANTRYIMMGIIDNESVTKSNKDIANFIEAPYIGYGLWLAQMVLRHDNLRKPFYYGVQFDSAYHSRMKL